MFDYTVESYSQQLIQIDPLAHFFISLTINALSLKPQAFDV